MTPLLTLRGVEKSYGSVRALAALDLELMPGQVLGLLGPNGAGKSTLIRIIMDIVRADAGQVELFGQPLCRAALDRVSYLPEERGLYRKQTVIDVLVYLGTLKGQSRAQARSRALTWLERVSLLHTANQRLENLSKGMSQQVQLISTFMGEPELFVLDEPFSGLDPINLRRVRGMIAEQRDLGRATILSTHQINEVEDLCDSIALLNRGQLLLSDSLANVQGAHRPLAYRVGSPDDLSVLPRSSPFGPLTLAHEAPPHGWLISLGRAVPASDLLNWLVGTGVRVENFSKAVPSLEEVFVRVVEQRGA